MKCESQLDGADMNVSVTFLNPLWEEVRRKVNKQELFLLISKDGVFRKVWGLDILFDGGGMLRAY